MVIWYIAQRDGKLIDNKNKFIVERVKIIGQLNSLGHSSYHSYAESQKL